MVLHVYDCDVIKFEPFPGSVNHLTREFDTTAFTTAPTTTLQLLTTFALKTHVFRNIP